MNFARWLEQKTRRTPLWLLAVVLLVAFATSCLTMWPVAEIVPHFHRTNSGSLIGFAPTDASGQSHRSSFGAWLNYKIFLKGNAFLVGCGFGIAVLASASFLRARGVRLFSIRPILLGTIVGTIFSGFVTGIVRGIGAMFGELNYRNPAEFFTCLYCVGASLAFVSCWWKSALKGRCRHCGYPQRGLPTSICPECGTAFALEP